MHVFILAMFGPFGHNWNNIIWRGRPQWRASIFCFSPARSVLRPRFILEQSIPYHVGVLVLFAILPFLSFVNLWDSYLSSARYSGNLTEATIYASDKGRDSCRRASRLTLSALVVNGYRRDTSASASVPTLIHVSLIIAVFMTLGATARAARLRAG